jgi:regulator of sigma D
VLKSSLSQEEKASQSLQLVAALMEERSELWAMYCRIAEMKPFFANSERVRPMLSRFSQLLIDYVSLGHFGVYEHLLTKNRQRLAVLSYANRLYPAFSNTTASAMMFNDAYDNGKRNFNTDNLATDLSTLGEHLAKRMELEDRLCSMLLH